MTHPTLPVPHGTPPANGAAPAFAAPTALVSRLAAAVLGLLMGLVLLYGTGFAQAPLLHSAAHDARHGLSLPCH